LPFISAARVGQPADVFCRQLGLVSRAFTYSFNSYADFHKDLTAALLIVLLFVFWESRESQ
jgi:hypothetical protein